MDHDHDGEDDPAAGAEESQAWENLCRHCGWCCYHKVRFGKQVVITDIPCPYLDVETRLCRVYPERFTKQPLCATAKLSVKHYTLPGDCPYVGGVDDYLAPHFLSEHPEYEDAVNQVFPARLAGKKKRRREEE